MSSPQLPPNIKALVNNLGSSPSWQVTRDDIERPLNSQWPRWLELSAFVMQHPDASKGVAQKLLRKECGFDNALSAIHDRLQRAAELAACALGHTAPNIASPAPPTTLEECLLRDAFEAGNAATSLDNTSREKLDLTILVITQNANTLSNGRAQGQACRLRLWRVPAPNRPQEQRQLIRAPGSFLLMSTSAFDASMLLVNDLLRAQVDHAAKFAIAWDVEPLPTSTRARQVPLSEIEGASASTAFALGALWLLREHVASAPMKALLDRIEPNQVAVTAQLTTTQDAQGWPVLEKVDGVDLKAHAFFDLDSSNRTLPAAFYIANNQGFTGDKLDGTPWEPKPCKSLFALCRRAAEDTSDVISADEAALLNVILCSEQQGGEEPALLGRVAQGVPKSLKGYLLHRYARWARGEYLVFDRDPKRLNHDFVHIDLELMRSKDDTLIEAKSLQELVAHTQVPAWLLVAGPGAGKTSLLAKWEMDCAWRALRAASNASERQEICIFLPMRSFDLTCTSAEAALETIWCETAGELPALSRVLKDHRYKVRLLCDALNEAKHADTATRDAAIKRLCDWMHTQREALLPPIFSVRTLENTTPIASASGNWVVRNAYLREWSPEAIRQYINLRLADSKHLAARNTLHVALDTDPRMVTFCGNPGTVAAQCALLASDLANGQLATDRAQLFSALALVEIYRGFSANEIRGDKLLNTDDRAQLSNRDELRDMLSASPATLPDGGELVAALQRFARRTIGHEAGRVLDLARSELALLLTDETLRDEWTSAVTKLRFVSAPPKAANRLLSDRSRICWTHQLWGEYFYSRGLTPDELLPRLVFPPLVPAREAELERGLADGAIRNFPMPPISPNEEAVKFAVQACAKPDLCEAWLLKLKDVNLALSGRVAVAVRARLEPAGDDQAWSSPNAALTQIRHALHRAYRGLDDAGHRMQVTQLKDVRLRVEYGDILGALGGSPDYLLKTAVLGDKLVPYLILKPELWKQIGTSGTQTTYRIGEKNHPRNELNAKRELEAIQLDGFKIAAFAVTAKEWSYFLKAGGYKDERWWQGSAAKGWRENGERQQPANWHSAQFNQGLQPVTGINVYEAAAYALFIRTLEGGTDTELQIMLPVEGQWEAAAGGRGKHRWPHGNSKPSALQFNHSATQLNRPSAVGTFPHGDTIETGVSDMAGNVWEWTSSLRTEKLEKKKLEQPADSDDAASARVIRGGDCSYSAGYCRAANRDDRHPDYGDDNFGCRFVRCSPPFLNPEPLNGH